MESEKKKIAFIVNPASGTLGKEQILNWLNEKLDREKYIPQILYTERAGHAVELAAQMVEENAFAVVAIGGDGTINEVARSLVHTDTALGIIPCGSGNGLARHLEIPMDARKAIAIINEGLTTSIDYGMINEQPFFCTCGVGFDAFVSKKFAEAGKRGPLTYIEKTVKESLNYRPETYTVEIDGKQLEFKAFVIACGNASQYGNNAYITPRATLTDGMLDVTIIEPFTMLEAPTISFQLFTKTLDQNEHIRSYRCRTLRILRGAEGVAHFDGDPIMLGKDIEVKIIQQGLNVIVPSKKLKESSKVLAKAQDYLNGIDAIMEGIAMRNKRIIIKGKRTVKKILS